MTDDGRDPDVKYRPRSGMRTLLCVGLFLLSTFAALAGLVALLPAGIRRPAVICLGIAVPLCLAVAILRQMSRGSPPRDRFDDDD